MAAMERSRCAGEVKCRPAASGNPASLVVFFKSPLCLSSLKSSWLHRFSCCRTSTSSPTLCRSLTSEGPPALGCWSLWPLNTTLQQPLILIKKDWRTITQAKNTLLFGNSPQSSCCSPRITYTVHSLRPELILNLSYVKNHWWCGFRPYGQGW